MVIKVELQKRVRYGYGVWFDKYNSIFLCCGKLAEYFGIPDNVTKIDLIISSKKIPHSYKIKAYNNTDNFPTVRIVGQRKEHDVYNRLIEWVREEGLLNKAVYAAIEY